MSTGQVEIDPILAGMFRKRRPPSKGTRSPARTGSGRGSGGSGAAGVSGRIGPAQLVLNAYGVPQAVVKVTRQGRTMGGTSLRNQLQYIAREGEVDLQGAGGEVFEPGVDGRHVALAEDWQQDFDLMDKRTGFYTYHLVVSYPKDTDRDAAERAAEAFAQELTGGDYGDRWKYALAHHRDTEYPHSHLVLNRRGIEGQTLHISRHEITVQDLRELHVETAGREAIELNATSRASRNVHERPPGSGRIHAARAGRELRSRPEPRAGERESFPFHGSGYRPAVARESHRQRYAAFYGTLARSMEAVAYRGFASGIDAKRIARRLGDAVERLQGDAALPNPQPPSSPAPSRQAFEQISAEVRKRYIGLKKAHGQSTSERNRELYPHFARTAGALLTRADRVRTGIDSDPPPRVRASQKRAQQEQLSQTRPDAGQPMSLYGRTDDSTEAQRKRGEPARPKPDRPSYDRDDDGIDR